MQKDQVICCTEFLVPISNQQLKTVPVDAYTTDMICMILIWFVSYLEETERISCRPCV